MSVFDFNSADYTNDPSDDAYYNQYGGSTNYGDYDPPSTGIGSPGTSYTVNPDGTVTINDGTGGDYGGGSGGSSVDTGGLSGILKSLFGDGKGGLDILKLGALGGGALSLLGGNKSSSTPSGYQGGIPRYTATRNMVTAPDPSRRPGAGGTRYGGDVTFTPRGSAGAGSGAGGATNSPALGLLGGAAGAGGIASFINPQGPKQSVTNNDPFYQSPEYQAYQKSQEGMMGTMDVYNSPYFGQIGSGSSGRALDEAYEKYKNAKPTGAGGAGPTMGNMQYRPEDWAGIEPLRNAKRESVDIDRLLASQNPNMRSSPLLNTQGGASSNSAAYASGGVAGLARGRYLQGGTDGMADKIPARIGRDQPAALSHGEFVIPADVVSHLGNGNSDAGAKKLYSMMDNIRKARTGTKKQGKRINPDKFMPGGLAQAYAAGGEVQRFQAGGISGVGTAANAGVTGTESNLSNWVGPYVTDMLGKGQALSEMPYQEYGGPLTAGASNLQQQAFGTAANLAVPGSVGTAAQTAGDIASKAQNMGYTPTQFTNQFNAPAAYTPTSGPQYNQLNAGPVSSTFQAPSAYQGATFGNQFKAPEQSEATKFQNQFQAPSQYQNTAFTSGTFGGEQAQQYMNPYLQASLNPQLEEARRQSQITEQANKAAMTRAGAFGGGRGAILAAENQRNLGTNLANITGKGYDTAFQNAMSQFNADQARNMQAQQASEQSKQFGAGQSMTAAQMMAQYGMSAQQAQEAARQFNQQQAMTGAQSAAQYGLAGRQAEEASRQFGAGQGLQAATTAGAQGLQAALANQQAGLTAGQGNINAALEAARQAEASRQFGAQQGMTAAQQAAQYGQSAQQATEASRQFGAQQGLAGLNTALQAAKAQGDLGISSGQLGLANLQQQAALGAQQRGIDAEGIAADKLAFEEARANPYKMVQFQQSLLSGLPLAAQNINVAQPSTFSNVLTGAGSVASLLNNLGLGPKKD